MSKHCPRVLVVSHNVMSMTGNMGKTMVGLLSDIPSDHLAQLYFHSEIPTLQTCCGYFRITDSEILKSIIKRKPFFKVFDAPSREVKRTSSRVDRGLLSWVYQFSRRRTPGVYFLRNLIWKLGKWNSPELNKWIDDFAPDVIFFAAGDYSFAYSLVSFISKQRKIPVVMWCADDHFTNPKSGFRPIARYNHRTLLKSVDRLCGNVQRVIAICDKMKKEYSQFLPCQISTVFSAAPDLSSEEKDSPRSLRIVYAGNLGVGRLEPLLNLSRALKKAAIPGIKLIDVYSGERRSSVLSQLTEENGIKFHGVVSSDELSRILSTSRYLLHVESFEDSFKVRTRLSVSTKIPESLASRACLLCYAPCDIASAEYLSLNGAAFCSDDKEEIVSFVLKSLENDAILDSYIAAAIKLVEANHSRKKNAEKVRCILEDASQKRMKSVIEDEDSSY